MFDVILFMFGIKPSVPIFTRGRTVQQWIKDERTNGTTTSRAKRPVSSLVPERPTRGSSYRTPEAKQPRPDRASNDEAFSTPPGETSIVADAAIQVLVALGIRQSDARKLVAKAVEAGITGDEGQLAAWCLKHRN